VRIPSPVAACYAAPIHAAGLNPAGVPAQLPGFLWQAVKDITAAKQPLQLRPLQAAVRLVNTVVAVLDDKHDAALSIDWSWAAETVQDLLNCAVAVGLMWSLPGGTTGAAAALYRTGSSNNSSTVVGSGSQGDRSNDSRGSSSSWSSRSSSSSSVSPLVQIMCKDIIMPAMCLLCCGVNSLHSRDENLLQLTAADDDLLYQIHYNFLLQPAMTAVSLQLLA
jgi:hypothetical protein